MLKEGEKMPESKDPSRETKMAIAVLEILLVLMLAVAVAASFANFAYGMAIEGALAVVYLAFLWLSRKKFGGKAEHAAFFAVLVVLVQLAWIPQQLEFLDFGMRTALLAAVIFAIVIVVMFFRFFYSKNYAFGKVVSCERGKAIVEMEYDFFGGTGSGLIEVACAKRPKKGERVKVLFRQAFMGKKPVGIE